jgi:hypothetical protein
MLLQKLVAFAGTCLVAGLVTQDLDERFLPDTPSFRVKCTDWKTMRPSAQEVWERAEPVEMTMDEAIQIAVEYAKQERGYKNVRALSSELVLLGKPYYEVILLTKAFNPKKQKEVFHRWTTRVGLATRGVKLWLVQNEYPGTPLRGTEVHTLPSGVQYSDIRVGDGAKATPKSRVRLNFVMSTLDGRLIFDTYAENRARSYVLKDAPIPGIAQGLVGARANGKRKLIIPPELAWGEEGIPDAVPPNATVVYDIELVKVH